MITVSSDFKLAMKQPVKEIQAYLEFSDGRTITSADNLQTITIACESDLLKTAMKVLTGSVLGKPKLVGQSVDVYIGVRIASGSFEYVKYGSFLITEATAVEDKGTTTFKAYDNMVRFYSTYTPMGTYPMSLIDYLTMICNRVGVQLASTSFVNDDLLVSVDLYQNIAGTTFRDILGQICEVAGANAIIGSDGRLQLKYITDTTETITYANMKTFKIEPIYGEINSVVLSRQPQEDNVVLTDDTNINTPTGKNLFSFPKLGTITLYQNTPADWAYSGNNNQVTITNQHPVANSYIKSPLTPFTLMNGQTYTLAVGDITSGAVGAGRIEIERYTIAGHVRSVVATTTANTNASFLYDTTTYQDYAIVFYASSGALGVANTVNYEQIYLAHEATFSGYEPYEAQGVTEIKIINNEILDDNREGIITSIFDVVHGVSFYPFNITTEGLGWYEIGDKFDIVDDLAVHYPAVLFNLSITVDGGFKERLYTKALTKTETNYRRAGGIDNRIKNTEIQVDKQGQDITSLVTDMYAVDGVVNQNFTTVQQDIDNIITSVQKSGGNNLILNSAMFAFDTSRVPYNWAVTGAGTLTIQSSSEATASGSASGNVFILADKKVVQRVTVKPDDNSIPANQKTYYTFSCKVKKASAGTGYIKISNLTETYQISFANGDAPFYGDYELKALLPVSNYYDIEIYGTSDSGLTITDAIFALGNYKTQWQQANGEIMNTQVNISEDGILVRSSIYLGYYTSITPLEFAGYSVIGGTITKIFTLNKDTTEVKKLKVESQITMTPLKIVAITTGTKTGWAIVGS